MNLVRQPPATSRNIWDKDASRRLDQAMARLGLTPEPAQVERLRIYGALLLKWNRTYNLLGATSAEALIDEHLIDSLAILPALTGWLGQQNPLSEQDAPVGARTLNQQLVDVGSGAGLPGMVLAIMLDHLDVALVEPTGKKTAFLRQAVAECHVPRVRVLEARLEDLTPSELNGPGAQRSHPTHFICRAFTSLERFAGLCKPQLQPGTLLFAMKAVRVAEELQQLSNSIEVLAVVPLDTLGKDVQRNLVVMRAVAPQEAASDTTRPDR